MIKIKTKEPSAVAYASAANILYFILCVIINKTAASSRTVNIIFLALSVLLWFIMGNVFSRNLYRPDFNKSAEFILLSFLPVLIFLITYNILMSVALNNQTSNWLLFYFVGAPILFFIKPAVFLLGVLNIDFYLFVYLFVAALMFFSFLGLVLNRKNIKKRTFTTVKIKEKNSRVVRESKPAARRAAFSSDIAADGQLSKSDENINDAVEVRFDEDFVQVTFDSASGSEQHKDSLRGKQSSYPEQSKGKRKIRRSR
jgi:uncharacterized protein YneF (UPF0154 family)